MRCHSQQTKVSRLPFSALRILAAGFAASLALPTFAVPAHDTLTLTKGDPVGGQFEAYRNGRFYFRQAGAAKSESHMREQVTSLTLEPAAKVSLKLVGKSKQDDVSLAGYEKPDFLIIERGHETRQPAGKVSLIEPGLDFNRSMAEPEAVKLAAGPEGAAALEQTLKPGVVNIVHFHAESSVPSVRMGNYVSALASDSKGKIEVVRIAVGGPDSQEARRYGIASVPQFWFYDRAGRLTTKLTERFTSTDIEAAMKDAQRRAK